jgi:DNA mismatch endonuclease (patch repair protein)
MRAVKSAGNTSTELKLIRLLRSGHLSGWRRNYPLFGKPDFVFPQDKIALFADGCFWHGHNCRNISPVRNAAYWKHKVIRNRKRDVIVTRTLAKQGWRTVRLWECQISKGRINKLIRILGKPHYGG